MTTVWPAKDPNDVLDFTWTAPLDSGDAIATGTFAATVLSGTVVLGAKTFAGAVCRVFISGGADGEIAQLNLTCDTDGGRTWREVGLLPVVDRANALLQLFRMSFPAFASIEDGAIGFWLAKAATYVDASWSATFRDDAKVNFAAHKLVETGVLKTGIPHGVTMFKSGDFSANFSQARADLTGFKATDYGREFLRLRRICFGGPRIMSGA